LGLKRRGCAGEPLIIWRRAGVRTSSRKAARFHDLRHTFASHLIIDLGLSVAQVSRILGHASVSTTLNIDTHLFDDARHATEIRTRRASSPFARLLEPDASRPTTSSQSPAGEAAEPRSRRTVDRART
jgi:integrase